MASARKLKGAPASGGEFDSFRGLQARLLKGASERIHADIEEAQRRGLIDATGKRTSRELPEDMLPSAERDFGGQVPPEFYIVAGAPGTGKSRAFPVSDFGVDFFNADDRAAELIIFDNTRFGESPVPVCEVGYRVIRELAQPLPGWVEQILRETDFRYPPQSSWEGE